MIYNLMPCSKKKPNNDFWVPNASTVLWRQTQSNRIDARNYGVTGKDSLSPAGVPGWSGQWSMELSLHVPFKAPAPNPPIPDSPPVPSDPVLTINSGTVYHPELRYIGWLKNRYPDGSKMPQWAVNCWPLPGGESVYYPYPPYTDGNYEYVYQHDPNKDSLIGIKFVDQNGDPFPIDDGTNMASVDQGLGPFVGSTFATVDLTDAVAPWGRNDYVIGGPYAGELVATLPIGAPFNVPFIKDPAFGSQNRPMECHPVFTWDVDRMDEIAVFLSRYQACFYWRYITGWGPPDRYGYPAILGYQSIVDYISIDPNDIYYGPPHFWINRPTCRPFGLLTPCGS